MSPDNPPPEKKQTHRAFAGIVIVGGVVVIAAVLVMGMIHSIPYGSSAGSPGAVLSHSRSPSEVAITISTSAPAVNPVPAGNPDPFPDALRLNNSFPFSGGSTAGLATVYRVWMNETYFWHDTMDNNYYIQTPHAGNKYLFLFVNVYNAGNTRFWPPTRSIITVHYGGQVFFTDPGHCLPDETKDLKPIDIREVQYYPALFGAEYVGDYGYSHGSRLAYLYPGKSNAMDGYLIYEVPAALTPEKAYAVIEFNGRDTGVWNLGSLQK